ncbi:MAG: ROK family protein [Ignavibacteriaceae bacterium]
MRYENDKRIVMTLDAGGTNLVFSALQSNKQIVQEIALPTESDNLEKCLENIKKGFEEIRGELSAEPAAISFAFPGPADYPNGIIGDLPNLPAFRGGVALRPILQEKFKLPVFINNDGDLYAYGEAIAGFLPYINEQLERAGSTKRYKNLLGLTLGTGFGAGIVHDGRLFTGDNSIAGEIWLMRDKLYPESNIEEHASIRGIRKIYAREAKISLDESPSPKEIYEIGKGLKEGDSLAAKKAFSEMAEAVGDAISNAVTLIDGLVVIGGGLAGASELFLDQIVAEMNSHYISSEGKAFKRLVAEVFNLEDPQKANEFLKGDPKEITVYGTNKKITYDSGIRTGVGISKIGTSKAIATGAYAFALNSLDNGY